MRKYKKTAWKIVWRIFKIILPKKYLNYYYYHEFINCPKLKDLSLGKKIWCFKHGFVPKEYFQYDLAKNDHTKYIGLRLNSNQIKFNYDLCEVINNKILFEIHMQTIVDGLDNIHVIRSEGYIDKGGLMSLGSRLETGNYESLRVLLEKTDLILKPVDGSRGEGVFLLKKEQGNYRLSNDIITWDKLLEFLGSLRYHLIQEKFVQKGFSSNIYPHGLNTMRICTIINDVTHEPSVAYAAHRFCSPASGYTDNGSQGGLTAYIDENGVLGSAITMDKDCNKEYFDYHPVTKHKIFGEQIPDWENKKKSLKILAGRMPYFKNIGWDIAMSDNDLYILEGNIPDITLLQIFKPAKECEPVWSFFKRNNFFE